MTVAAREVLPSPPPGPAAGSGLNGQPPAVKAIFSFPAPVMPLPARSQPVTEQGGGTGPGRLRLAGPP